MSNKVLTVSGNMNNEYISHLKVIEIDKILEDLFIPEWILDEILEDGFIEEYESGDHEIVVVQYDYKTSLVALNTFPSDQGEYVYIDKDGSIWVANNLPSVDLIGGSYYAGDESICIGQQCCFETDQSWLWNSLNKVNHYQNLRVSKDTMEKVVYKLKEGL
jgi:hypothetical protein